MEFFDKMSKSISSKSKDIANKAKEMAEVSSLNGQISSQEEVLDRTYLEMGKALYEAHKEEPSEEFVTQFEAITSLQEKIEQLKKQIQTVKGVQVCPVCGGEITAGAAFCFNCGQKLKEDIVEVVNTETNIIEVVDTKEDVIVVVETKTDIEEVIDTKEV